MRTFAECMIVAVCALTSTVKALDAIQNVQTLTNLAQQATLVRTEHEFLPCWLDRPDPACRENEYLDRSGLIDNATTDNYVANGEDGANDGNCVCRLMPLDCGEGFIWDYLNGVCKCVNPSACPVNYYFDYNTCGCVCQNIAISGCEESTHYWSQSHCECRCKPTTYADTLNVHTLAEWNSDTCSHNIVEDPNSPCSEENTAEVSYFFSTTEEGCVFLGLVCPSGQYYDGDLGYCLCDHQNCGPNEYFDNGNDSCYCRCIPQVCPEHYSFNNDQCECDCLEPTGENACADTDIAYKYWSTEDCGCLCRPIDDAPEGKFWDSGKCNWSCAPVECEEEERSWDFDTCECRCCPSSLCGPDQFYNTLNCSCQQTPQDCAIGNFWYVDETTGDGNCVPTPAFIDGDCDWDTQYWSFITNACAFKEVKCEEGKFFNGISGDCEYSEPNPPTGAEGEIWNTVDGVYQSVPYPCPDMMDYYDFAVGECICRPQVCGNDQIFDYGECKCRCKPEQCPDSFRWSENLCDCVCAPPTAGCDDGSFWADNLCQCVCEQPADVTCADGEYWSHEYCQCLCGPTSEEVPEGQYWNTLNCQFECTVQTCEAGEYFRITEDAADCACECLPHECAEQEYWNTDTCCCDCLPQDCVANSVWDVATCSCKCLNEVDAEITPASNQYWDIDSCSLKCAPVDCDAPEYFDYDTCECECEYPSVAAVNDVANSGKWFSLAECAWVAAPQCQDEWPQKYWDQTDNTCKCFDQACPSPYNWNSTSCTCECNVVDGLAQDDKEDCAVEHAYEWNQDRCECQLCEVQECTGLLYENAVRTQFWNAECCMCQCIPWKACDGDIKWDFENCDCLV